jgi:hypothetical protein
MTESLLKRLIFLYWTLGAAAMFGGFALFLLTQNAVIVLIWVAINSAGILLLLRFRCPECGFPVVYAYLDGWRSWPRRLNDVKLECNKCGSSIKETKIGRGKPQQ